MIGGLLLALFSAALINLGFLLQHRGLGSVSSGGGGLGRLRRSLSNPVWLSGQALGWAGFCLQIIAVAIAPLSLVQAFAAGGLALSVPLAAGIFRQPVTRRQTAAVLMMSAGLALLPFGISTGSERVSVGPLVAALAAGWLAAGALSRRPGPAARAAAAGIFYGLADAAIKAVSLNWHAHGTAALMSGWTVAAAAGTFAGFLCFQSALDQGAPVPAISLMTAGATLVALACGLGAFGESLGASAAATLGHGLAIAVVLAGVPTLAAAQLAIVKAGEHGGERTPARPRPLPAIDRPR